MTVWSLINFILSVDTKIKGILRCSKNIAISLR